MKLNLLTYALLLTVLLLSCKDKSENAPAVTWNKVYGGSEQDWLVSMVATPDGGYLLGGTSNSDVSGEKSEFTRSSDDYWVVKINADGSKAWDKTYGGAADDKLTSIINTPDGGYLLGGYSLSIPGNDKTEGSRGKHDYWVVKLNANGSKAWDRTFGGDQSDALSSMAVTADGGYVLVGSSGSGATGDKTDASDGVWVVKLNADGSKGWDRSYGGIVFTVAVTTEGSIILGGQGNDPFAPDYRVIKLNADGTKVLDKLVGGNDSDNLQSLVLTADGGYLLAGTSRSHAVGDKSENRKGNEDYWVVKLNKDGNKVWDRTFGGSDTNMLTSVTTSADGGYLLGGFSNSAASGDKSEVSRGGYDYWIVKLDAAGNKVWDKTYGGNDNDLLSSVISTKDGGFLVGGSSNSKENGDKISSSRGGFDFWIIKIANRQF